jgi:hypothetical protein
MTVPSCCDRDIAESPAGIELTERERCSEPLRQNQALTASLHPPRAMDEEERVCPVALDG